MFQCLVMNMYWESGVNRKLHIPKHNIQNTSYYSELSNHLYRNALAYYMNYCCLKCFFLQKQSSRKNISIFLIYSVSRHNSRHTYVDSYGAIYFNCRHPMSTVEIRTPWRLGLVCSLQEFLPYPMSRVGTWVKNLPKTFLLIRGSLKLLIIRVKKNYPSELKLFYKIVSY